MCICGGCYPCLIDQGKVPVKCSVCGKPYENEPKHFPFCSEACEDAAQVAFHMEVKENDEGSNQRFYY